MNWKVFQTLVTPMMGGLLISVLLSITTTNVNNKTWMYWSLELIILVSIALAVGWYLRRK